MDNLEYYGYLVNGDNYDTSHLHNDLYELFDNKYVSIRDEHLTFYCQFTAIIPNSDLYQLFDNKYVSIRDEHLTFYCQFTAIIPNSDLHQLFDNKYVSISEMNISHFPANLQPQ